MPNLPLASGVCALAFATAAAGQGSWQPGIEIGATADAGRLLRLTLGAPPSEPLIRTGAWSWTVTPEITLGRWWDERHDDILWDAGITPVLSAQRGASNGSLALELGVGVHLLSAVHFEDNNLASAFQFGDHVGIEWQPDRARWRIGYRFQHLSNAGIAPPNDGVEFHVLRLGWRF